jgi:hypothetical protein
MPPLLRSRPAAAQVALALVTPVVFGALTGVILGVSSGVYIVLNVFAAIGGYLAGFEHADRREAALRGIVGGTLFGSSILIAHEIAGTDPEVKLPDPAIVLLVFTIGGGILLGILGRATRTRFER